MLQYVVAYVSTLAVFLACDFVWLTTMGSRLYKKSLGDILAASPNFTAAALFYLLFVIGVVIFAVSPAFDTDRWTTATIRGALFGFFAYSTYDLTNQATLRIWSTTVTIADMGWGTLLTAVAATAGFLVTRALKV